MCRWKPLAISHASVSYVGNTIEADVQSGTQAEVECVEGFSRADGELTKQIFECTNDGWDVSDLKPCVKRNYTE